MGPISCFYPKIRICMATKAICFCYSEVKKKISLKQMFYPLFDTNFSKSFIPWYFFALRLHLDRNDSKIVFSIMTLRSSESRFPIPFVSSSNHRSSPFCLLL